MQKLMAVVFCGGNSTRMGSDKGLLPSGSENWLLHSASLLSFLPGKVLASVQAHQVEKYASFIPFEQLVPDNLQLRIRGPVCGLLSVYEKYPENDLFVLACDLQQMNPVVLQALVTSYTLQPGFDAYLWTATGEPEPLCGIYCSKGLRKVYTMIKSGTLERHSMKFLLSQLNCNLQAIPYEYNGAFKNFNSQADVTGQ